MEQYALACHSTQIEERCHWAFAEVVKNWPLCDDPGNQMIGDRSVLKLGNTDNGRPGWDAYGSRDLAVGTPVELFEYRVFDKWYMGFRVMEKL